MKEEVSKEKVFSSVMQNTGDVKALLKKMASAGLGASIAEISSMPIDMAKVRLQVSSFSGDV